jgi:hypothetical protein
VGWCLGPVRGHNWRASRLTTQLTRTHARTPCLTEVRARARGCGR